jgi:hypothetical protein
LSSITVRVLLRERVREGISGSVGWTMPRGVVADTADRVKTWERGVPGAVAKDIATTAMSVSRSPGRGAHARTGYGRRGGGSESACPAGPRAGGLPVGRRTTRGRSAERARPSPHRSHGSGWPRASGAGCAGTPAIRRGLPARSSRRRPRHRPERCGPPSRGPRSGWNGPATARPAGATQSHPCRNGPGESGSSENSLRSRGQ